MKNIFRIILALALLPLTASPSGASADIVTHIVISELQTAGNASASEEFVELYNPTGESVSLSQWSLEYKSATSSNTDSSWSKKATLAGEIKPGGFYLVAATLYFSKVDSGWTSTLAASGGHVRLLNEQRQVIDKIGYGETANASETTPALAPPTGQSLERLPGRLNELAGNATDTDNNTSDFILRNLPGPQTTDSLPEVFSPGSEAELEEQDTPPAEEPVAAPIYPAVTINELLVDPLSPLADSEDEFIELYNSSTDAIDLAGYVLKCGSNFRDYYVLPDLVIQPGGYLALYSNQTKLGLTNSGGAVQLSDPSGDVVDQTADYEAALVGQAWARFESDWQWTLQLTPGQANVLALLPASITTKAATSKVTTKKTAVKAAPKPKKKAVKAAKVKKPKKPKKAKVKKVVFAPQPAVASRNLQPATWLIISLVVLTIGYAIYEFRLDLYSLYLRARGNHPPRKADRQPIERRGDD